MRSTILHSAAVCLAAALPAQERTHSEVPPGGAPWRRDFLAAHAEAQRSGKPIFVYSTKTH